MRPRGCSGLAELEESAEAELLLREVRLPLPELILEP